MQTHGTTDTRHGTGISQAPSAAEHADQASLPRRGMARASDASGNHDAGDRDDITRGEQVDEPGKTPGAAEGDDSIDEDL